MKIFRIIPALSHLELEPHILRYERRGGDLYSQGGGVAVLRGEVELRAGHHPRLEGVVHRVQAAGHKVVVDFLHVVDNLLDDPEIVFSVLEERNGNNQLCSSHYEVVKTSSEVHGLGH